MPKKNIRSIEGFTFDDQDGELELPVQLMEQHIKKMRQKGVYFVPTVFPPDKKSLGSAKKRPKAEPKGKAKRPKKSSKGIESLDS